MKRSRRIGWRATVVVGLAVIGALIASSLLLASSASSTSTLPGFYAVEVWFAQSTRGLAIEPATGHIWAGVGAHSVRSFDHTGTINLTINPPNGDPQRIRDAVGVEFAQGEVFIVDTGEHRVQVWTPDGSTRLRDIDVGFAFPCGIEIIGNRLFVQNTSGSPSVLIFALNGNLIGSFDGADSGSTLDPFTCYGDNLTALGNELYVADFGGGRVAVFDNNGVWQHDLVIGGQPTSADIDGLGQLWVTDYTNDSIRLFNPAGALLGELTDSGSGLGQINAPSAIVVDPSGNSFWLADHHNNRVQLFTKLACDGERVTHFGSSYDDRIVTGSTDDIVHLGPGDDVGRSGAGDDRVCGAEGDDDVRGGGGADIISGGGDNDSLRGQGGTDLIEGDAGNDTIDGGGAADMVTGGGGDDVIGGQNGADVIDAGPGDDVVAANTGPDTIDGGSGNDDLGGGSGNDTFFGGPGLDRCAGNSGNGDSAESATCEQTPGIEVFF